MSDGELLINRRKLPRWKCSMSVKFRTFNKDKFGAFKDIFVKYHNGLCRDMSAGGTLLITKELLEVKDRLSFKIYMPATDSNIKTIGEVVWLTEKTEAGTKKYFIGVKYTDIITESDDVLEEILVYKLKTGARINLSKKEALRQARYEYFMRLINEETYIFDSDL